MIPIPTLPTDNLYKFLSVAGLVILVASVAVYLVTVQQTANDSIAIDNEIHKLSDELLHLRLEMHDIEFQAAMQSEKWSEVAVEAQKGRLAAVQQRCEELDRRIKDKKEAGNQSRKIKTSNLEFCMSFSANTFVLGAMLASTGFSLWWYKVQRLQDAILKCDLDKLQRDLVPNATGHDF